MLFHKKEKGNSWCGQCGAYIRAGVEHRQTTLKELEETGCNFVKKITATFGREIQYQYYKTSNMNEKSCLVEYKVTE